MKNSKPGEASDPNSGRGGARPGAGSSFPAGPVYIFLLGIAVFVFLGPGLWNGLSFYFRDLCLEIIPKRMFWAESDGFALWNPYVFFGMPYAANMQGQAFYPINLVYFLGPVYRSLNYFMFLHLWIAGILAWLMLGEAGLGKAGRLAGAVVFAFGGFIVSSGLQVVNLGSVVWLPGLVWLLLRALRRGAFRSFRFFGNSICLGLMLSIQFLGGEPEVVYISIIMLAMIGGFTAFSGEGGHGRIGPLARCFFSLVLAGVVLVVLTAFQWMPALEMSGLSNRAGGLSLADATIWSFAPGDLITLLVPHHFLDESLSQFWGFGMWPENFPYIASIYCGASSLILMLFAIRSSYKRQVIFWWLFLAFWLILSLGESGVLYTIAFNVLPGFDRFRIPQRCALGLALASSWLVAYGMEWFSQSVSARSEGRVPVYLLIILVLIAIVIGILLSTPCNCSSQDFLFYRSLMRSVLFATLAFLCIWSAGYLGPLRKSAPFLMAALIFLDLYVVHRNLNPMIEESFYQGAPRASEEMSSSDAAPPRALILRPIEKVDRFLARYERPEDHYNTQRHWLQPFVALSYGINDIGAHSSYYLREVDELMELTRDYDTEQLFRFLARSGAEYLLVPKGGVRDVPGRLPRAMVLYQARVIPDRGELLETWLSGDFDAENIILLEDEPPTFKTGKNTFTGDETESAINPDPPQGHAAGILEYGNEGVVIRADAREPGWLVLLDTFYPGWEAMVDGEPAEIKRANGFFRAVEISAGEHTVEFIYHPCSFYTGVNISVAGALFLLLISIAVFLQKRNK